jgi:hypothetical protein
MRLLYLLLLAFGMDSDYTRTWGSEKLTDSLRRGGHASLFRTSFTTIPRGHHLLEIGIEEDECCSATFKFPKSAVIFKLPIKKSLANGGKNVQSESGRLSFPWCKVLLLKIS